MSDSDLRLQKIAASGWKLLFSSMAIAFFVIIFVVNDLLLAADRHSALLQKQQKAHTYEREQRLNLDSWYRSVTSLGYRAKFKFHASSEDRKTPHSSLHKKLVAYRDKRYGNSIGCERILRKPQPQQAKVPSLEQASEIEKRKNCVVLLQNLALLAAHIREWVPLNKRWLEARQIVTTTNKDLTELVTKKISVPTPIGTLEGNPLLVLAAIGICCLLAYVRLAWLTMSLHQAPSFRQSKLPIWASLSFLKHTKCENSPWPTALIGHALHYSLIALGLILIGLSDNPSFIVDPPHKSLISIIHTLAIFVALTCFGIYIAAAHAANMIQPEFDMERRASIIAFGAGILLTTKFSVHWLYQTAKVLLPYQNRTVVSDFTEVPENTWISNANTLVIHHQSICADHLPEFQNRNSTKATESGHIHAGKESQIFEALARDSISTKRFLVASEQLRNAIGYSPTRLHLYDLLKKMYARDRSIGDLEELLVMGKLRVQEDLKLNKRKRNKLLADFDQRLRTIRNIKTING